MNSLCVVIALAGSMVDPTQRSEALLFLPRPINLDGTMMVDVGFDPMYLSSMGDSLALCVFRPAVAAAVVNYSMERERWLEFRCGEQERACACVRGEIGNRTRGGIWEVETWTGIGGNA